MQRTAHCMTLSQSRKTMTARSAFIALCSQFNLTSQLNQSLPFIATKTAFLGEATSENGMDILQPYFGNITCCQGDCFHGN